MGTKVRTILNIYPHRAIVCIIFIDSDMQLKAEATAMLGRVHQHSKSKKRIRRMTRTTWKGRGRGSKLHQQQKCLVQSLPPPVLLQRPHHRIDDDVVNNDNDNDKEDIDGCSSNASADDLLRLMDVLQLPVEEDMYVCLLKECTRAGDAVQGATIHAHMIQQDKNLKSKRCIVNLANRLLLMYTASNRQEDARQLFDRMPLRDANSWATIISALADRGDYRESCRQLVNMLHVWGGRLAVDSTDILVFLLKVALRSCIRAREKEFGQQIHGLVLKMAATNTFASILLRLYATFGCQESEPGAFRELIMATRHNSRKKKKSDSSAAYASILAVCTSLGDESVCGGKQVHAETIKVGLDCDQLVRRRMIEMYARFGMFRDARKALETCSNSKDAACWNAMLDGYVHNGHCTQAVRLLYEMKAAGVKPKESVMCRVRIVCGQ